MHYYYTPKKRTLRDRIEQMSALWTIIVITIILSFIFTIVYYVSPDSIDYFALKPSNIVEGKYIWTLLTHMFVHGGPLHLMVNMLALFSLGSLCEKIIGKRRFVGVYILGGLFAAILSIVMALSFGNTRIGELIVGSPTVAMVGASGAIFAIAGVFVSILPRLRFGILFIPFFSLPAYVMVPVFLVVVWIISIFAGIGIGNVAHLGGLLAGVGYGYYLRSRYRRKINLLQGYFR